MPEDSVVLSEGDENDDGASSAFSEQPMHFRGSVSKWRRLNHAERSLATSLEQTENDDLGIHLYNAHSLKRRLYEQGDYHTSSSGSTDNRPRKRKIEHWHRKERWMDALDEDGDKAWYPKSSWTAWPLEPHVVPRPDERLSRSWRGGVEEENWTVKSRAQGRWKPSTELEDILSGELQRTARERFALREFDHETSDQSHKNRRRRTQSDRDTFDEDNDDAHGELQAMDSECGDVNSSSTGGNELSRKVSQSDAYNRERRERRRVSNKVRGSGRTAERSRSWTDTTADEGFYEEPVLRPVVMADDENAQQILRPMIRHMIQKVDDLLMGLHHSRQNHVDPDDYESDSVTDTPTSRESSVATERDRSASRSRSRVGHSRSTTRYRRRRKSQQGMTRLLSELRPRDWSEVLGIATMTGWDSDVVVRTAARCTKLFGETMDFDNENNDSTDGHEVDVRSEDAMHGGVHVDGFMKPIHFQRMKDKETSDDDSVASETETHVEEHERDIST